MKCVLVFNPEWLHIHLDRELTKEYLLKFHGEKCGCPDEKGRPGYITRILEIKGIIEVRIDRHTIFIQKGLAFDWQDVILDIMYQILLGLDPTGEITQKEKPVEYYKEKPDATSYKTRLFQLPLPDPFKFSEKEGREK